MAIAGLGVDLARCERFRRLLNEGKQKVLARIFASGELEYSLSRNDPGIHLAARFAAKEAFLKAVGTGLRQGITWQDMVVENDPLGRPLLHLRGRAKDICRERGVSAAHLSYSHDGDYAVATVILEHE